MESGGQKKFNHLCRRSSYPNQDLNAYVHRKDLNAYVHRKDLNTYVHRKAKAWFRRFPPVNSPDRIDDDQPRGDGGVGETEDDKVDEDRAVEMSDAEGSDAV